MAVVDGFLYVATDGGLMVIGQADNPPEMFGQTNGLGTTVINDLMVDASGDLWLGGIGRLVRFDAEVPEQFLFVDNQNATIEIKSLTDDQDDIWVGTDLGLILFSKTTDGGQIQDSYQLMGGFNPNPTVNQVALSPDSIYLATAEGFAMADRTIVNSLKSPSAWKTFGSTTLVLLGMGVNDLAIYNDQIYLSLLNALYRFNPVTETFHWVNLGVSPGLCYDLQLRNDTLLLYCAAGIGAVTPTSSGMITLVGIDGAPRTGAVYNSAQWIGTNGDGLWYDSPVDYQEYPFTGASGSNVTGVAPAPNGDIFAGLGEEPFGRFSDGIWTEITRTRYDRSTNVIVDSSSRGWIGSWGGGLALVDGVSAIVFDTSNSTLSGNSDNGGANYIVIRGLDNDGKYLFAAAYRSLTNEPIVFADLEDIFNPNSWGSFGAAEGLTNHFVSSIDYQAGWLAIGTDNDGVYLYYLGPDPWDKSDDFVTHYTETSGRLPSNIIRVVKFSPDGTLWAGTNLGLAQWNFGYERFDTYTMPGTLGPNVDAIEFDSRGNVWVGAQNGVGRINLDNSESVQFTPLNSGLVSASIRSLTYSPGSGQIFIGTDKGISIAGSFIGNPATDVINGYPFPNPFVIRSDNDRLNFSYAENGTVGIFSLAGELVAELSVNAEWDGTNQSGRKVASGVYMYIFTSDSGEQHQGKILLVRD